MRGQESSVTANSASERLSSSVGTNSKAVNQLPHIGGCRTEMNAGAEAKCPREVSRRSLRLIH